MPALLKKIDADAPAGPLPTINISGFNFYVCFKSPKDISLCYMNENGFIVRVYGIYIDDQERILVSDEYFKGKYFTKFPGGGLEYGESTTDCLIRELKEELDCDFLIVDHFYTTDFFVESAFHPGKQLLSIYYFVTTDGNLQARVSEKSFDFNIEWGEKESFRFVPFVDLQPNDLTFIIDRHVALLLKNSH